jgi:prephenate dehydrogenase
MSIQQITIVGTGLIGGSLGLALRQHGFQGTIVGCDKPEVLERALTRGAIDRGGTDAKQAVRDSDVVVLATPVGAILSLFEKIAPTLPPATLIADTGSTKRQLAERARMVFGTAAGERVLPGHPMAGKELGGIENADPALFRNVVWLITPIGAAQQQHTARQTEYLKLLESIGARVIAIDPERHDRLCAWISHLPQMISTALASLLQEELGDEKAVAEIGGRALQEMTRIAHSPYSMWRDIALTNGENLEEALLRYEQQLAHLRENLCGPGLRELFEIANQFGHAPGMRRDHVAGKQGS